MSTNENISPKVIREIAKELKSLHESPPEGIKVLLSEDNVCTIFAEIEGPVETPYEGGLFKMKLVLSSEFPNSPPKGYFLTRIFHPNIAKNGEICVNTLKKDWRPTLGIRHILLVIRCLLIEPYPESALNEDAGKLLMENYDEYAKHARLMTSIHATKSKSKNPLKSECNMDSSISSISTPLAAKVTNTENGSNPNMHLNSSLTSASYQDPALSGLKKIKNDSGVRASSEKQRKTDARKKNLKRL